MSTFVREGPITILRVVEGTLDKSTGRFSPSTEEEVIVSGNIQPVSGDDLVRAPEGARLSGIKTLFLHVDLEEKDILLYKGERYQIQKTDDWDPAFSTIPHYKYMAQLVGDVI